MATTPTTRPNGAGQRNQRYREAVDSAHFRVTPSAECLDSLQRDLDDIASLAATTDALDQRLLRFCDVRCHKSGRLTRIMEPAEVRRMLATIGTDATEARLTYQWRVATHPYWLQTDGPALRQNCRIDPAGAFVYMLGRAAGWQQGSHHAEFDWYANGRMRGGILDAIEPHANDPQLTECNEMLRRLLALADSTNCRRLLPDIDTHINNLSATNGTDIPCALAALTSAITECLGTLVADYIDHNWARFRERGRNLTASDISRIQIESGGSKQFQSVTDGTDEPESTLVTELKALGFGIAPPARTVALTEAERREEQIQKSGWSGIATIQRQNAAINLNIAPGSAQPPTPAQGSISTKTPPAAQPTVAAVSLNDIMTGRFTGQDATDE